MSRTLKVIMIILLTGIILESYYIHENPVNGYYINPYHGIQGVIYVNILLYILVVGLILYSKSEGTFLRASAILFLAMLSAVDLLFPYIRGVQLVNAFDTSQHVGFVMSILKSAHINFTYNFYPALHILAGTLVLIANTPVILTVSLMNPVFSLTVYPMFIYLLSKKMFNDNLSPLISVVLALTLPLNYFLSLYQSFTVPNGLAYLLFPFYIYTLYTMLSKHSLKWVALSILLTSFFVILHPLANVLLILFILLVYTFGIVMKQRGSHRLVQFLAVFYVIAYVSYIIYLTNVWTNPLMSLKRYIEGKTILSQTAAISQNVSKIETSLLGIVRLALKTNTASLLFLVISALFLIYAFKRLLFGDSTNKLRDIILLSFYIVLLPFLIIQLVAPGIFNIAYYRFMLAMLSLAPVVVYGYYLKLKQKVAVILIFILVSTSVVIAYQISYPSPYSDQINSQATTEDAVISAFILNSSPENFHLYGYISNSIIGRLFIFHLTLSKYQRVMWNSWSGSRFALPDHLGYGNNSLSLAPSDSYIVLSNRDILAYTKVWKKLERINWKDLHHLNSDNRFDLVYSTKDYWMYRRVTSR